MKNEELRSGYIAFNGHVFTELEAEGYNIYIKEIKRAKTLGDDQLLEGFLNRRAVYFRDVIGS